MLTASVRLVLELVLAVDDHVIPQACVHAIPEVLAAAAQAALLADILEVLPRLIRAATSRS